MKVRPASRKILVVVPSLARGGAERTVSRLTLEWERGGHDVSVAVFNAVNQAYRHGGRLLDLGAPARPRGFARLFSAPRNLIVRALKLRRLLRTNHFDHVFAFMESANIPVLIASLGLPARERLVVSVRGNPGRMPWFHKAAAFCLYGIASRVVTVSKGAESRLAGMVPGLGGRVETIHSPVDPVDVVEKSTEPEGGFFAAGRLVRGKGFDRMLRIFAGADLPGVMLRIAGEGPEFARLESSIRALGLEDRVKLLGALDDPLPEMRRALAFLMTSEHEGFPVALIEAMACGCPVVAFDCDFGPREAFRDGVEGFLVPPADDAGFARSMERIARDMALRAAMARAASLRAADFDAGSIAARWLLDSGGEEA